MIASVRSVPAYGSDRSGMICAFRFSSDEAGRPMDSDEALAYLDDPDDEDPGGFAWLHFDLTNVAAEKRLREHLDLPEAFYEGMREGTRATRLEEAGGALVAIVNDVLFDFAFEATQIATLIVAVTRRFIITGRRRPLRSIDRLRISVRDGEAFRSPTAMLVHLLRDQAEVLVGIVRDATTRVDAIEDTFLAERLDVQRTNLGGLRRVLVRLRRVLAPEPTTLFRLLNRPPRFVRDDDVRDLRQATEEFAAALNDLAVLLERIKLLQEEVVAKVSEQSNRLLLLISVVTVVGLPFMMIGGLFGMNVKGIPFEEHPYAFWIIVVAITLFTIAGTWLLFRVRRP